MTEAGHAVIDLARVGMGRLALVREPVDLEQAIDDACSIVGEYVAAKGLWLRVEVQPDLPSLELDRLPIRQVLLNLLTNAARFTQRGREYRILSTRNGGHRASRIALALHHRKHPLHLDWQALETVSGLPGAIGSRVP